MLKLMYITNDPDVARIAVNAGVDRIFIDMEVLGKAERQGNLDSVKSHHVPGDIARVRQAIGDRGSIIARIDPLNPASREQIDASVANGADMLMLPMWKTPAEAARFISLIGGRCKAQLLLETAEAAENIAEAARLPGVDEVHIGLNDLHLSCHRKFMFELLADGTVERLTKTIGGCNVPYGFGGVGRPGQGLLPAEYIIAEHYRLGSSIVILSRSFCNTEEIKDRGLIRERFCSGVAAIREAEREYAQWTPEQFRENQRKVKACVNAIVGGMG